MERIIAASEIEAQADQLSTFTALTPTQAEVLLRWRASPDDYRQRDVASDMGITESAVSKHLREANYVLGREENVKRDDPHVNALMNLIALDNGVGGPNTDFYRLESGNSYNGLVLALTRYAFEDRPDFSAEWRLHVMVRDTPDGGDISPWPDGMTMPTNFRIMTFDAETKTELTEYALGTFKALGMQKTVLMGIAGFMMDAGINTPTEEVMDVVSAD